MYKLLPEQDNTYEWLRQTARGSSSDTEELDGFKKGLKSIALKAEKCLDLYHGLLGPSMN